ncbi:MAG TPA: DUF6066 family protein [Anaeromyxobacteraceae bacterium]|nr:DUF6066 family protein [Anaeromyxobacteraceae bacterium]
MRLSVAAMMAAAALAPTLSRADQRFTALVQHAQRLQSLPGFLERFVGACKDPFERRTCEQNVRQSRRVYEGKTLVTTVSAAELLRAESDGSHFRIVLTPFIDGGGGYALTHGEPVGQDPAGRPRIGFVVLHGDLPPGMGEMEFRSPFRTGFVEMEVVFRAEGTWKMRRRDGGYYEGVRARFLGVRLLDQRTGGEIASRVM